MDMVDIKEKNGLVLGLEIKPAETTLRYAWITAVWTPAFTEFLHQYVTSERADDREWKELYLGTVIADAIEGGLCVQSVVFPEHRFLDIGTPEDLFQAVQRLNSK